MIPLQELKDLIDMTTGKLPFNLAQALEAVAAVLQYTSEILSKYSPAEVVELEDLDPVLAMQSLVAEAEGGVVVAALLPKEVLAKIITKFLLNWLANQLTK